MKSDKSQGRSSRRFLRAGEIIFSTGPMEVTTVLGSCVSVWLVDWRLGHSSICHFKGPAWPPKKSPTPMYADIAIARQIEGMMTLGSRRRDLRAYIIGGGNVIKTPYDIGRVNTKAATEILEQEGIEVAYQDTGGTDGRKVVFNTSEISLNINKVPKLLQQRARPRR